MKNRGVLGAIGLFCILPVMLVAHGHCERGCDRKLDALSATLQRIGVTASEAETSLGQYQQDCCEDCADILRRTVRASQCSCDVTPITQSISITAPGCYCLVNDDVTSIITEAGIQVAIDLNGHTVNGSVFVSDHGYVHNGSITGQLGLSSYSRAESITLGGPLQGVGIDVHDVVARDIVLTNTVSGFLISNFAGLTLDRCNITVANELYPSIFNIQNVVNLIVRNSYVLGSLWLDLSATPVLETFSIYDSHITDELYVYIKGSLSSFTVLNSAIDRMYVDFQAPHGTPSFLLHGLSSSNVFFASAAQHFDTKFFIDDCTLGRLIFQRVSNIHCQDTITNASPGGSYTAFAPVHIESCNNGIFQDVMATNTLLDMVTQDPGFYIAHSKNMLFKNCFSIAEMGTGYSVVYTSTAINFQNCVAKGCFTGFWSTTGTSGSVMNCSADGCGSVGFSEYSPASIIYAGNVACFNFKNYFTDPLLETPPYYDVVYTVTAGSWRNMSL